MWRGGGTGWLGRGGHERHRKGWRAEDYAVTHLTRVGYHILARNVQVGPGEIDIVAEDPSGALAFIEVRSRDEEAPVRPV
ncbi:MAG: YraN family protein, partial [Armatimonadota bacterium]